MTTRTAAILVLLLYLLHQDFWFWQSAHPIVFGIFPIGLFYHVAYMLVTAALLWVLVSRMWPAHLDDGAFDPSTGSGSSRATSRDDSAQDEADR